MASDGVKYPPLGWGDVQTPNFGLDKISSTYVTRRASAIYILPFGLVLGLPRLILLFFHQATPLYGSAAEGHNLIKARLFTFYGHLHGFWIAFYVFLLLLIATQVFTWTLLACCLMPEKVAPWGTAYAGVITAG